MLLHLEHLCVCVWLKDLLSWQNWSIQQWHSSVLKWYSYFYQECMSVWRWHFKKRVATLIVKDRSIFYQDSPSMLSLKTIKTQRLCGDLIESLLKAWLLGYQGNVKIHRSFTPLYGQLTDKPTRRQSNWPTVQLADTPTRRQLIYGFLTYAEMQWKVWKLHFLLDRLIYFGTPKRYKCSMHHK